MKNRNMLIMFGLAVMLYVLTFYIYKDYKNRENKKDCIVEANDKDSDRDNRMDEYAWEKEYNHCLDKIK